MQMFSTNLPMLATRLAVQPWVARRAVVLSGMDAYSVVTAASPGMSGIALARTPASPPPPSTRAATRALLNEASAKGQVFIKTYDKWCDDQDRLGSGTITTWSGPVFGCPAKSAIDYILADNIRTWTATASLMPQTTTP